MEREKLESLIIDYIDNQLNPVDRHILEQELTNNTEARKLYEALKEVMWVMDQSASFEPSAHLQNSFEDLLKKEQSQTRKPATIFFHPSFYRIAAAVALLILGGGIGFWISKQNDDRIAGIEEQMQKDRSMVEETRKMMAMLNNELSASQRIKGVNVAMTFGNADDEIVTALVKVMNDDPNSNVRLAALEALSKFIDEPKVRKEIIHALSKQKDPLVQIELIRLLVKMKEKGVVNDLQKIVNDERTIQAVKDEAYSGILKLS